MKKCEIIADTFIGGIPVNQGEIRELDDNTFSLLKVNGKAVELRPEPFPEEDEASGSGSGGTSDPDQSGSGSGGTSDPDQSGSGSGGTSDPGETDTEKE